MPMMIFYEFGLRIGLIENRLKKILNKYRSESSKTIALIEVSYLSDEVKKKYTKHYLDRVKMLNNSFSKKIF
jgi:serine/threonine-protein kinase HipA